jgi:catechol 2,3-dioxygenase-like lactoylglutathione lyase family enzyme
MPPCNLYLVVLPEKIRDLFEKSNFEEAAKSPFISYLHASSKCFFMISRLSHTSIYVLNQQSAYDFYVNKLGFKVHTDAPMGEGMRWLTVCPPEQPELEITLMPVQEGMIFTKESAELMRSLVTKGTFGFGVFECRDIYATFEELKAKGVEFTKHPKKEFYGVEALFKDDSGNWFSLTQKDS